MADKTGIRWTRVIVEREICPRCGRLKVLVMDPVCLECGRKDDWAVMYGDALWIYGGPALDGVDHSAMPEVRA